MLKKMRTRSMLAVGALALATLSSCSLFSVVLLVDVTVDAGVVQSGDIVLGAIDEIVPIPVTSEISLPNFTALNDWPTTTQTYNFVVDRFSEWVIVAFVDADGDRNIDAGEDIAMSPAGGQPGGWSNNDQVILNIQ